MKQFSCLTLALLLVTPAARADEEQQSDHLSVDSTTALVTENDEPGSQREEIREKFREARELLRDGNREQAREKFREARKMLPPEVRERMEHRLRGRDGERRFRGERDDENRRGEGKGRPRRHRFNEPEGHGPDRMFREGRRGNAGPTPRPHGPRFAERRGDGGPPPKAIHGRRGPQAEPFAERRGPGANRRDGQMRDGRRRPQRPDGGRGERSNQRNKRSGTRDGRKSSSREIQQLRNEVQELRRMVEKLAAQSQDA